MDLPATAQADQPVNSLTVAERASLAVGSSEHEAQLLALAERAKGIVTITNPDGYKEAHATRIALKNARIAVTSAGKTARDDATAFSKAVIAEANRLIAIIEPDEERINTLQVAWDAALEAEKQRKIDEEAARVESIKNRIEAIRRIPLESVGKPAAMISKAITFVAEIVIDESYAEHQAYAEMVRTDATDALTALLVTALEAEAEQLRITQERAELETLREQKRLADEQQAAAERQRAAEETARLTAEREEANKKEYAAREELRQQQEESARLTRELAALRQADADRLAAEQKAGDARIAAAQRAEEDRIAEENSAADRRTAEEHESAHRLAQAIAQQEEERRINASIPALVEVSFDQDAIDRPSDDEIIAVIADHFDVSTATAFEWITSITTFQPSAKLLAA